MQTTEETSFRDRFVELCQSFHGLGAAPSTRDAYLDLIGPDEPPAMRAAFTTSIVNGRPGMSGCALMVRAAWKRAGVQHPRLSQPYVIGAAVSDVIQIAITGLGFVDLRRDGLRGRLPKRGDVLWMDAPEHVEVVTDITDHDEEPPVPICPSRGITIEATAGGQRDAQGWQLICQRERRWYRELRRGLTILQTTPSATTAATDTAGAGSGASAAGPVRTLLGWVDSFEVWQRFGTQADA